MKRLPLLILLITANAFYSFSQDVILKKDGNEIESKVLKVTPENIDYKQYNNLEGPTYSIPVSEVFMIKYQNGLKDVFNNNPTKKIKNTKTKTIQAKKSSKPEFSSFADPRDGEEYKTVKIGDQWWMAENLNFESNQSWCYDNKAEYCEQNGRLYTYEAAINVCPDGWHLPSDEEWKDLEVALGMKLGVDTEGWRGTSPGQGYKMKKGGGSGLDMELSGTRYWGAYYYLNKRGIFWTYSESIENPNNAFVRELEERASIKRTNYKKENAFSVRCINGNPEIPNKLITTKKLEDKYFLNKEKSYLSLGLGSGSSYGDFGLRLQGKFGFGNQGAALHIGFGFVNYLYYPYDYDSGEYRNPDEDTEGFFSYGVKYYFYKQLYANFSFATYKYYASEDYMDVMHPTLQFGGDFAINKDFNLNVGIGYNFWVGSDHDIKTQSKIAYDIGINWKIFKK